MKQNKEILELKLTIKKLRMEIKELEAEVIQLNQRLINGKVKKEEKYEHKTASKLKNLTPVEKANLEKEETRRKWAEWRKSLNKKEGEKNES